MRVVTATRLEAFATLHPDARKQLSIWLGVARRAEWTNIQKLREFYPHADAVKVTSGRDVFVFNVKGNAYRLIVAIHFNRGTVYVLRFLTHAEYSKDRWKEQL
jgi:mRNA interferase HigB